MACEAKGSGRVREQDWNRKRSFKRKKGLEAGVSNVPLLLAYYSQYTSLALVLVKRQGSYTKGEELCRGVLCIAPKLQLMLVHPSRR
jgi:hypothetical protein